MRILYEVNRPDHCVRKKSRQRISLIACNKRYRQKFHRIAHQSGELKLTSRHGRGYAAEIAFCRARHFMHGSLSRAPTRSISLALAAAQYRRGSSGALVRKRTGTLQRFACSAFWQEDTMSTSHHEHVHDLFQHRAKAQETRLSSGMTDRPFRNCFCICCSTAGTSKSEAGFRQRRMSMFEQHESPYHPCSM
jgi:hypothetical protein